MKYRIITQKVLNENTGEIESKDFHEITPKKVYNTKRGFRMIYLDYDIAVIKSIRSTKDLEIVIHIRELFTKTRYLVNISARKIAKDMNISISRVTSVIKRMVDNKLLCRVDRGIYRLNPFMYLPCQADGASLQEEWTLVCK